MTLPTHPANYQASASYTHRQMEHSCCQMIPIRITQTNEGNHSVRAVYNRWEGVLGAYHFDELRQLELDGDREGLRNVDHRPNQLVVAGDEIIVQPLRIGIPFCK
ncbi:hypothetical protein AVEN_7850-1 [Araneus ventricosus]|uniref:Uncharacterized protein n=1 Tax=Araneus ventricosus TaxID=182803 RepID=A0A4Y2EZZ5_ARAVE|nr:hypothetical protein AVEN_7850-1 [Araneus ventricosus]